MDTLKIIPPTQIALKTYQAVLTDAVVLTQDNRLLMQQRPKNWGKFGGNLNLFGGHVEEGETPLDGLIRELNEELGAIVKPEGVILIGAVTEDMTDHTEIVHIHFWHDKEGTITGCYEAEAVFYEGVEQALNHPQIMDYAIWALKECQKRNLLEI